MLRPSYSDLLEVLEKESDDIVKSRYTIVTSTAKRARQIIEERNKHPEEDEEGLDKPVTQAVNELYNGLIKIQAKK